jgi:hypothetical protein
MRHALTIMKLRTRLQTSAGDRPRYLGRDVGEQRSALTGTQTPPAKCTPVSASLGIAKIESISFCLYVLPVTFDTFFSPSTCSTTRTWGFRVVAYVISEPSLPNVVLNNLCSSGGTCLESLMTEYGWQGVQTVAMSTSPAAGKQHKLWEPPL